MKWINFLHLYQPPTQSKEILDTVVRESYSRILQLLVDFPDLRLTVNFSGSLIELLVRNGHKKIVEDFAEHVKNGRIELVGSAMYHPILPLIPEQEIRQQINAHDEISRKYFGASFAPKGFYLPEMAYSDQIGQIIKNLGFEWIILDEIHAANTASTKITKIDPEILYNIKDIGLGVIFRNTGISKTFPPEYVVENSIFSKEKYLITAHDGELYGHWHTDDRGYYGKAFSHPEIQFILASDYIKEIAEAGQITNLSKNEKSITVREASWESTQAELENHIPFSLWNDPQNIIHEKLWALAHFSMKTIETSETDAHISGAVQRLHQGLASCSWWWASKRKLGPFSPITWNPKEIERGATELLEAVRTLKDIEGDTRVEAEKIFTDLHAAIWDTHWKNKPNNQN